MLAQVARARVDREAMFGFLTPQAKDQVARRLIERIAAALDGAKR